jgi:hypothetical protein
MKYPTKKEKNNLFSHCESNKFKSELEHSKTIKKSNNMNMIED